MKVLLLGVTKTTKTQTQYYKVLNFAGTRPTIQATGYTNQPSKKGCFIATVALGSEIHHMFSS